MIDVQGSQLIPPLLRFRQTAGASGSPSLNMEVQFEIITASASGGVSAPWVGEEMGRNRQAGSAAWGDGRREEDALDPWSSAAPPLSFPHPHPEP